MQGISAGEKLAKVLWYYGFEVSGSSDKIVCPFHDDVNPSLIVNFENGSWYCFGCNKSGDAERFVKLMEQKRDGCNDLEAMRRFIRILKSDKANAVPQMMRKKRRKRSGRALYDEAYDYYHGLKTVRWSALESLDEDALKALEYMENRGFDAQTLEKCGAKVNYSQSYGLIFPMMDNGKFRGWVCRTMIKEVEQKRKYLYNEGFSRATTLVGDYSDKPFVVVVEGYMDRLKLLQFGIENAVAILGWKMTLEQIEKLKAAGITKVISALDNDECGRKGTKWLARHFEVTRWRYLKGVKDPGDFEKPKFDKMRRKTMQEFRKDF